MQPMEVTYFDRAKCSTTVCLMLLILISASALKIDYDVHEDWYSNVVSKGPDVCFRNNTECARGSN